MPHHELIYLPLIPVNFIHVYPETTIHDLMHLFGIDFLKHGRRIGHIGEKNSYQLAFAFDSISVN